MTKSPRIVALAATLLLSTAAFAATGDFSKIDANADGKITLEEGMKLHPDWTESAFKALDTNADGSLNELEYETAVTAAPGANDPAAMTRLDNPCGNRRRRLRHQERRAEERPCQLSGCGRTERCSGLAADRHAGLCRGG